jgi:Bacterial archaeo-eukaryotic release factor family 2
MTLLQYGPDRTAARAIVRPFQPVSWAYMHLGRPGKDARHSQLRAIRERVGAGGASLASIEALSDRLQQAPVSPSTLAVFADTDGTIVHEQALPLEHFDDVAGYSSPADVSALLAADQARPPFVCAVVDRLGADITYAPGGDGAEHEVSVVGPDDDIRHNAPGGWAGLSQSRYENRAHDSWQHNARRVAERIDDYAVLVDAQAVIICGKERATGLVGDALHVAHDVLVEHLDGSRTAGHDRAAQARRLRDALDRVAERQTRQLLATFGEGLGTGRAVQGARDTVSALAAGRVAILLVDPAAAVGNVWFGAGATELYADHDQALLAPGAVESGPLARVAIRAALLSGAQVRILPAGAEPTPLDGIGALCRFGAPT